MQLTLTPTLWCSPLQAVSVLTHAYNHNINLHVLYVTSQHSKNYLIFFYLMSVNNKNQVASLVMNLD